MPIRLGAKKDHPKIRWASPGTHICKLQVKQKHGDVDQFLPHFQVPNDLFQYNRTISKHLAYPFDMLKGDVFHLNRVHCCIKPRSCSKTNCRQIYKKWSLQKCHIFDHFPPPPAIIFWSMYDYDNLCIYIVFSQVCKAHLLSWWIPYNHVRQVSSALHHNWGWKGQIPTISHPSEFMAEVRFKTQKSWFAAQSPIQRTDQVHSCLASAMLSYYSLGPKCLLSPRYWKL